jgi:hypothetical protein
MWTVLAQQDNIQRLSDFLRSVDDAPDYSYSSGRQYLGAIDNAPVSPRQYPQDDSRRPTLGIPQARGGNLYRPPVPSNLSNSARRPYGSIGSGTATQSSPLRNAAPAPRPEPHPLSKVETPQMNMGRRHTLADLGAHGLQTGTSPFSNAPTAPYPSSPSRPAPEDQRIRESFSTFSLQAASQPRSRSRPTTPPPPFSNGGHTAPHDFGNWSWNSAANRDGKNLIVKDSSAPPTRRGSMAHILNPTDTAERAEEGDDPRGDDDRKRKRMQ